jgi:hypothetical protein
MYAYTYVCMCVCVCVYICVRVCVCVYIQAKQTAGSLIVDALLSHTHTHTAAGAPPAGAANGLSSKQRLQKTNALIQILGDYRQVLSLLAL